MPLRAIALLSCWLLLLPSLLLADDKTPAPNTLTAEELNDGWILLFDGETTFGWKANTGANWEVADGAIAVSQGTKGLLNTTTQFADYELKVDFRAPDSTNSGIFLRGPVTPTDAAKDCYELNIADEAVSPYYTGSFVNRIKAKPTAPSDSWRTFTVKAVGGHFLVSIDGAQVLDYTDPQPIGRGHIGLQINQGPVEFRNIKLKPLGLTSIFNGKDLTGWKETPDKKSKFSVTEEGALRVKNGNGQIEYEKLAADFVLQLDIFSNGKYLNSGVFFRNIPGGFWQGYESQIQNAYLNNDRTKPFDFGTGAIYRRQKARKVVSNDKEWFHKTLVADGPHMAVWINGIQVSDFTDERPANENARDGLRLKAGTIAIQGHDATTDLSFRNLRLVELPAK